MPFGTRIILPGGEDDFRNPQGFASFEKMPASFGAPVLRFHTKAANGRSVEYGVSELTRFLYAYRAELNDGRIEFAAPQKEVTP